ncbi:peptide ABC transporter substrate-binding protein [Entomospira nematocerorum]|nr:peptide ABC transporter substrate-binding protein [Entomospira nematocera]WDI34514.1 peptide ABC transporter substrate-binding protein [Entomospira nematocera]
MIKCVATLCIIINGFAQGVDQSHILRLALANQNFNWDPQAIENTDELLLFSSVYQGLVQLDAKTLQPLPALAESWSISDDGLQYTFYLRSRLYFSDGTPITAESFYRSVLRLLDPYIHNPNAELLHMITNAKEYAMGAGIPVQDVGVVVLDERTIQFNLVHPAPYFFEVIAHPALSPLSGSQLPMKWQEPRSIPFSGPYLYAGTTDKGFMLRRNRLYWNAEKVNITTIDVQLFDVEEESNAGLRSEEIDWAHNFFNPKEPIHTNHRLVVNQRYASQYFTFIADNGPYAEPDIRKALIMLLPLQLLRESGLPVATTLIPPTQDYSVVHPFRSDYSEGMLLLSKAGYPEGEGLPTLVIQSFHMEDPRILVMQEAWGNAGISVEIYTPEDHNDYYQISDRQSITIMESAWSADYLDPLAFLFMWQSDSLYNVTNFRDQHFDELIKNSHFLSGRERLQALAMAEKRLLESAVVIPMNFLVDLDLVSPALLTELGHNPLGVRRFENLNKRALYTYYNAI